MYSTVPKWGNYLKNWPLPYLKKERDKDKEKARQTTKIFLNAEKKRKEREKEEKWQEYLRESKKYANTDFRNRLANRHRKPYNSYYP